MSEQSMLNIEIDGQVLKSAPGSMVIQVADQAGIYIPRFCYHEKLSVAANCRMCLVEVEKAPKPLPACATPVMDGMIVKTRSAVAVDAQKDTLEFLLINHPLDCPICDQGGECPLQDQSVGYGGHLSRFEEKKRVVADHDIGPLIETEMTRCIHCTRCVRFGEEIAGVMELGITGRSEHLKINTFFGSTVDSEVSGNMIDLCPVGALTSKPYRFSARAWELINHESVSPHDCVGTNINIQTLRGEVKRVLPRLNESINECWLADRDRYSYEAVSPQHRLTQPMLRTESGLSPVSWEAALQAVVQGMQTVIDECGADAVGALVAPTASFEEFYLLQKLFRALGSNNIDHRLRQIDFSGDAQAALYPSTSLAIEHLSTCRNVLLVGSNIRKEQPILGLRLREAWRNDAKISAIGSMDWSLNFELDAQSIVAPSLIPYVLAQVLVEVCKLHNVPVPTDLTGEFLKDASEYSGHEDCQKIAALLYEPEGDALIVLGHSAIAHSMFSCIEHLARHIAKLTESHIAILPPANSVAGWLAGCLPHRLANGVASDSPGLNARQMIHHPRTAYVLYDIEPTKDLADGLLAEEAIGSARFVVSLQSFAEVPNFVDVVLPIVPFTENAGTFINCEGRMQQTVAAVAPMGEARPGWKIMRVLGNLFGVPGFDQVVLSDVLEEAAPSIETDNRAPSEHNGAVPCIRQKSSGQEGIFELISDPQIYAVDATVRRADALQATVDAKAAGVGIHPDDLDGLDMADGTAVVLRHDLHAIHTKVVADARVARGCVYFPAGSSLGPSAAMGAEVRIENGVQVER